MTREEAIEVIKAKADYLESDKRFRAAVETIIPELRESEDERVMKELLAVINDSVLPNEQKARFNAWLEKQKESLHIPETCKENANSFTDEDERIRKILLKMAKVPRKEIYEHEGITKEQAIAYLEKELRPTAWGEGYQYGCKDTEEKYSGMMVCSPKEWGKAISAAFKHGMDEGKKQKEQKPVEYIPDSVKFSEGYKTGREVGFREGVESVKSTEWSEEDKMNLNGCICSLHQYGYMTYADFLRHLPERFNLQPKEEWSKEDEDKLYRIIETLLADKEISCRENPQHYDVLCKAYDELISWLKSLPLNLKKKNEDVAKLCYNEWSKEDEEMLVRLLDSISIGNDYKEMRNWLLPKLKSLRPQPKQEWSENDTVFLKEIIDYFENKTVRLQHDLDMYAHWLKSLPERLTLPPRQ